MPVGVVSSCGTLAHLFTLFRWIGHRLLRSTCASLLLLIKTRRSHKDWYNWNFYFLFIYLQFRLLRKHSWNDFFWVGGLIHWNVTTLFGIFFFFDRFMSCVREECVLGVIFEDSVLMSYQNNSSLYYICNYNWYLLHYCLLLTYKIKSQLHNQ